MRRRQRACWLRARLFAYNRDQVLSRNFFYVELQWRDTETRP